MKPDEPKLRSLALHLAKDVSTMKLLLSMGFDLHVLDSRGQTPLAVHSARRDTEAMILLLDNGAKPNVCNTNDGRTPLHHACAEGHREVVEVLLQYGAGVNLPDNTGLSPLQLARARDHTDCIRLLLDHGADANTPIHAK
ncbi:PREDICTED: BRCA1-associated RING domain protein 1-like [Priapulus caudatus]|uniref:BRCA1-associated RING domain protein 1-like n=1 Tax=Priapulus caudatus TaxID=37621 RepID=A0ABM1F8M7_PRICU|nr:PREDICTED: BRCA1-associated RING domain protein 1-like [Priapulus caudatus]